MAAETAPTNVETANSFTLELPADPDAVARRILAETETRKQPKIDRGAFLRREVHEAIHLLQKLYARNLEHLDEFKEAETILTAAGNAVARAKSMAKDVAAERIRTFCNTPNQGSLFSIDGDDGFAVTDDGDGGDEE